jgi:hemerythrin-like domain-containing protein
MQIDKFKQQHVDILRRVAALRELTHAGIAGNAQAIAEGIIGMSAVIKLHLAVEDQALYPALQRGGDAVLARLGRQYQDEMGPLAQAYDAFARRWNTAQRLRADAEGFRADANNVLRRLHERMQRENHEFYPRIEAQEEVLA